MQIEEIELMAAAAKAGISKRQAEQLWNTLSEKAPRDISKFDLSSVLYYFGAMIVIVAMGWFLGITWESFGGGGALCVTLVYMLIFLISGAALHRKEDLRVPGGLFITIAVCLIPLAVYSFQRWTDLWVTGEPGQYKDFLSWVGGGWFAMEAATVLGGCIALKFYRFPFLTVPIFFTLWFISIDVAPLIIGNSADFFDERLWISIVFGMVFLLIAYTTDLYCREDFAFWGYFFGTVAFWSGLSLLETSSEFNRFLYCLVNVGMVLLSVFLQRSVFLIFGAIGILSYITALFYRYFSNSAWFPLVLSLIGVFVIYIGLLYHKNRQKIDLCILNLLPSTIQAWLPKRR